MSDPSITLSEGQKSCLRLVAKGMSSKEIAKATGLTPQTVDTYVKAALARLGASNRREAARMLVAWEISQQLGSPSPHLAGELSQAEDPLNPDRNGWLRLRLPPVGGETNDLSWAEKTYEAMRVAAAGAAIVIAITLAIAGLIQTVR